MRCYKQEERAVIAREVLKSIRQSSHQLCVDQINAMGLQAHFEIQRDRIICHRTGSTIIQAGLRDNADSFRSTEGITILFIDEAQMVSAESLNAVTPTIRKPGSVILFAMNPRSPDDPVYDRFVVNTPPNGKAIQVNYCDNPMFPDELRDDMEHMKRTDPDLYRHVWLGEPIAHLEASILGDKYRVADIEPKPGTEFLFGADFGFAQDPSAAIRCWIEGNTLYIDHEAYGDAVELDDLGDFFSAIPEMATHTSRADNARPETISYLKRHGLPHMVSVDKWPGSIEDGIAFIRAFDEIVVHPRCENTIRELSLYSWKQHRLTGDILPVPLDAHNHSIDALRYALAPLIKGRGPATTTFVAGAF